MNKLHTTLLFTFLVVCSCMPNKKEKEWEANAEVDTLATSKEKQEYISPTYYYLDNKGIVHITPYCYALDDCAENGEVIGVKRFHKSQFNADSTHYYCVECVYDNKFSDSIIQEIYEPAPKSMTMPGVKIVTPTGRVAPKKWNEYD